MKKITLYRSLPVLVILLSLAGCGKKTLQPDFNKPGQAIQQQPLQQPASLIKKEKKAKYIDGVFMVIFRDAVNNIDSEVDDMVKKHKIKSKNRFKYGIKGFTAALTPAIVDELLKDPRVKYIEQDREVEATGTQVNTPSWGLDRIDQRPLPLDGSYKFSNTASTVDAYIFDTGIRLSHPDFGGRAIKGYDFTYGGNVDDENGHGTHVAGTLGGNLYGTAKGITMIAVKVLGKDGFGNTSDVVAGLDWAVNDHTSKPAVGNLSLGSAGSSPTLEDAVRRAVADGIVMCVAAGNLGIDADDYSPARVTEAITVGATDSNDHFYFNYGSVIDILAPGINISSDSYLSDSSARILSGTSMASPHVAGAAALYLEMHPRATPAQVEYALKVNGTANQVSGLPPNTINLLLNADFSNPPPLNIPFQPRLNLPGNYASATSTYPIFSWNPSAGADFYNLQVSKDPYFTSVVYNAPDLTTTSASGNGFEENTTYYWRVNAKNAAGTSDWSATWNFTPAMGATASPPVLITPYDEAKEVVVPATFYWSSCPGARSYRFQISTNAAFTNLVYSVMEYNGTSATVKGLNLNTNYYWRVNAYFVTHMSPWSEKGRFRTLSSFIQN